MLNIIIKYNLLLNTWILYINKYLFRIFLFTNYNYLNNFLSIYNIKYFLLVKILRQFGIIKPIINIKDYVFI